MNPEPRQRLAAIVRRHRIRSALTLADLASATSISKALLSLLENAKLGNPPADERLHRIAVAISVDSKEVLWLARLWKTPPEVRQRLEDLERRAEPEAARKAGVE